MSKAKDRKMAEYFKALGHPVRLQIVQRLLGDGACYAGNITDHLPVVASTASQHLKILTEAGVIAQTVDGPHRVYSIRKDAFLDIRAWLRAF